MKGIDTNVLVRLLTQDDAAQARRVDRLIASARRAGTLLRVDAIALAELVWVLRAAYGFSRDRIADALEALLDADGLEIEDADLARDAVGAYRRGKADFSDYFIGRRNAKAGCATTVTFDRTLRGSDDFTVLA